MEFVTYFHYGTGVLAALIGAGILFFLRFKKQKSLVYLFFFALFYVYIVAVLNYTVFQYQSLVVLKFFMPGLMLNGFETDQVINLIPLATLTLVDVKTSFFNILLFVPFGFGLPFIARLGLKKIVILGALFSLGIELVQYLTGVISGVTFRITDINDVIFNTLGAVLGFCLFILFGRVYRLVFQNQTVLKNIVLQYIDEKVKK